MPGWRDRFAELEQRVGDGPLQGQLVVSQRYAAKQHVEQSYRHPRGGGPNYVSAPLAARAPGYVRELAEHVLDGGVVRAMADNMEDLADQVTTLAPVDRNILRQSAHPTVSDNGRSVYDRAAKAGRLR